MRRRIVVFAVWALVAVFLPGTGVQAQDTEAGPSTGQGAPPPLAWAGAMGGAGSDGGRGVAVDAAGNVYITGDFNGTADFDPGPGVVNLTSVLREDAFVAKLDSAGSLVWARAMGGTGVDQGRAVAVDGAGNVYITGFFWDTADFDPGPGVVNLTSAGLDDVFVAKLDSAGNLVWARAMGGTKIDRGDAVTVDGAGNVYTSGGFSGPADFDSGPGVFNLTSSGDTDGFVFKLDGDGNLVWARAIGGTGGEGVVVDGAGNVYTTGRLHRMADFDPGPGVFNLTPGGDGDVFVSKLDGGGDFVWARAMGGSGDDGGKGVAVDASGDVYTTGRFQGTADFDPGSGVVNLTAASLTDVFVSKLDAAGVFVWARALSGTGPNFDTGLGVAVDPAGNVYTIGLLSGTADFDPGPEVFDLTSAGDFDVFVSKLDSGGEFVWAGAVGGTGDDWGWGVAVDASGNVYATGSYNGTADLDPGPGEEELTSPAGTHNVFVLKLLVDVDTVGLVDVSEGQWHLRTSAGAVSSFSYGNPVDLPIAGDWDGDGDSTPGLYRQADGFFYARNSNTAGPADNSCYAGNPSDVPVSGDWDGDGDDNVGIYRPSEQTFYLFTTTCTGSPMGSAQISFLFGNPGDNPVAGDWDGDGKDEVGLYRESTGFFYWRDTLTFGNADGQIFFGDPGDSFVSGDWGTVDGADTPAIFRPGDLTFYFRHTLTQGLADSELTWTGAGVDWLPVSGRFGLG